MSGAVAMQAVLYYQLYPKDPLRVKVMVSLQPPSLSAKLSSVH